MPTLHKIKRYGWKPSLPDARDHKFGAPRAVVLQNPPYVNLRPHCPAVWDQLALGSCTAFATGAAYAYDRVKQKLPAWVPSWLFIYYNSRAIEGSVPVDSGATVRDACKSVATLGAPPGDDWPYDISKFAVRPPTKAYSDGANDRCVLYQSVPQDLEQMKAALAGGFPIVVGIAVYDSFESDAMARTGVGHMPNTKTETLLGGHCILCVGYNNKEGRFYLRNSWGAGWGQQGYFTLPFAYLTNPDLAGDFWVMKSVA